jgi:hypothetical protein
MDFLRLTHISTNDIRQRLQQCGGLANPRGQGGTVEFNAGTQIDSCLPVQRHMVGVLGNYHLCQQAGCGHAACDRARRRRFLDDLRTTAAAQPGAHVADHPEVPRHVVQHLGGVFTQLAQPAAALGAVAVLWLVLHHLAWQVRREFARAAA